MVIVKIKSEFCEPGEVAKEFKVIEDRLPRVLIEPLECTLPIPPTETLRWDQVEVIRIED